MSKHHHWKNNQGQNHNPAPTQEAAPAEAVNGEATTVTVEDAPTASEPDQGPVAEAPAPEPEPVVPPAEPVVEPVEPPKQEQPKEEPAAKEVQKVNAPVAAPGRNKIMSADLLKPQVDTRNAFQSRRAANIVGGKHTVLGNKLLKLFETYRERMKVATTDRNELMARIRMLQTIVNTACPTTPLDMQTATDVVRIFFDEFMTNYDVVYKDHNMFQMGNYLKGSAYELDKMVVFVEAFVQMVNSARENNMCLFDDMRVQKVLRNRNVAIAMGRIRDNLNKRVSV